MIIITIYLLAQSMMAYLIYMSRRKSTERYKKLNSILISLMSMLIVTAYGLYAIAYKMISVEHIVLFVSLTLLFGVLTKIALAKKYSKIIYILSSLAITCTFAIASVSGIFIA